MVKETNRSDSIVMVMMTLKTTANLHAPIPKDKVLSKHIF